jgi:hypothetical protein
MRALSRALVLVVLGGFAATAAAQGLGDAARREKERRAKVKAEQAQKADKPAKTYTDDDLRSAKGDSYTEMTGPAGGSSEPTPPANPPAVARLGPSPAARSAKAPEPDVAQLEQRVRELEKRRAQLPPGPFGPSVPCVKGAVVTGRSTAIGLRDAPQTQVCDPELLRQQEAQRVQAELDQARAALEKARGR